MRRVIIVGGGAAGIWQAACLAAKGVAEIDIIEPRASLGRGTAYETDNPDHLLNVTPDKMDAYPVPGYETFVSWLARNQTDIKSGYSPRGIFGAYMDDVVCELHARMCVRHHRAKATEISSDGDGFAVSLDNGQRLYSDDVILAIGNLAPHPVSRQTQSRRIIEDPWRLRADDIAGARRIAIAGAGLTAVDVVISAVAVAPDVEITLTANRPFMPPSDATIETWPGAADLPVERPSQVWKRIVAEIRRGGDPDHWVSVIEGTKTHTPRIWQAWSQADRATFVRHGLRHWLHHRHRMPAPSYALLQQLLEAGQVKIARGRIGNVEVRDDQVHLSVGNTALAVDVLINATGPSVEIADDPLLASAASRGLISRDPLGLGLAVSPSGQSLAPDGQSVKGLWVLGAWTRGTHFEVVAVPLVRKHAAVIAEAIAGPSA